MNIKELAQKHEQYIIDRRRFYHTCPELSLQEKETIQKIRADLIEMGITDIRMMETCYGLIADIHGAKPGKTIALRADIDGLSVPEATGLPFASQNPGVMHACGHDNHIAIQLGAAKILQDCKDELCGTVRLVFQPAEEVAQGARRMVAEGAMEGVDALYGAHVWSTLEAPYVDVSAGNRMACCHSFTIEVDGMTAHASAPHLGKDAISIAAAIINNLQQCVSRMNDPLNPLVLTIGTIQGGVRWNCTAGKCVMEGTIRTFAQGTLVEDQMRKIVSSTAEAFGAKAAITRYDYMTDPVINQSEMMCRIGREAITKLYGAECIANLPTMMGSEDFSVLSCGKIPYLFGFVGSRNTAKGIGVDAETGAVYSNHHEKYDMDEDALHRASAVAAQIAADFLAENA